MANCNDVYAFLVGITNRNVTTTLSAPDVTLLTQLGLVQTVTADQYADLAKQVQALQQPQADIQAGDRPALEARRPGRRR